MEVARSQGARLLELRAAAGLGRYRAAMGAREAAAELVGPLLAWFSEGSDLPDLSTARALLEG
jgi:hypothetical protein